MFTKQNLIKLKPTSVPTVWNVFRRCQKNTECAPNGQLNHRGCRRHKNPKPSSPPWVAVPSKSYPVTIKAEQRPRSTKRNCCSWSSLFNYSIICNKRCFYNLLKIQLQFFWFYFAHVKGLGWSIIYDSDCEGLEITTKKKTRKEVELEIELWGWRTEPHCEWKTPCRSPHMRHCAPNICAPGLRPIPVTLPTVSPLSNWSSIWPNPLSIWLDLDLRLEPIQPFLKCQPYGHLISHLFKGSRSLFLQEVLPYFLSNC